MTDLGFGLVDRRSVLIVLFTLGLSNLVLGYSLPLDVSNALSAFLGLVLLTGFIYGVRSILRIVVLAIFVMLRFPYELFDHFRDLRKRLPGLRGIFLISGRAAKHSFLEGFVEPAFSVRDWRFYEEREIAYYETKFNRKYGFLGVIDRMLLVGVAFAATMPLLSGYVRLLGVIGTLTLILLYIVTGSFSLVLDDAMKKAELEQQKRHAEAIYAASNPNIGVITTKQYDSYNY